MSLSLKWEKMAILKHGKYLNKYFKLVVSIIAIFVV